MSLIGMAPDGNAHPVRLICSLLALVAVLLMPFGMTGAASAASSAQHHEMAEMPMGHCPDEGKQPDSQSGIQACTMVCSAALPAIDFDREQPVTLACAPDRPAAMQLLQGLHPETATPPPKRS